MSHKKSRIAGVHRSKVSLFILPEVQYMLEQLATQAGYVRTGKGMYKGRPDVNAYLEAMLNRMLNVDKYTTDQIVAMRNHQLQVIAQRKVADD